MISTMTARTATVPNTNLQPSPNVQRVVEQVRVLRRYTAETGFKTTRSQNQALQQLDGTDLANALLILGQE